MFSCLQNVLFSWAYNCLVHFSLYSFLYEEGLIFSYKVVYVSTNFLRYVNISDSLFLLLSFFFLETFLPAFSILLIQSDLVPSSPSYIVSSSVTLLSWILCFLGVLFSFFPRLPFHFSATFCHSQSPVVPRDPCCLRFLLLWSPLLHWIRAHLHWMQWKRWCVTSEAKSRRALQLLPHSLGSRWLCGKSATMSKNTQPVMGN